MSESALDLSPARWIWLPSQRTLANTMLLFRKELDIAGPVKRAAGWVCADSRYRLTLNGQRIQWGPAPTDPRWMEADPVDLTAQLRPGRNIIGAQVLYYGSGDGTWAAGKPGFIFQLDIEHADGRTSQIISDESWFVLLDRAYRPGQYRRWYLRAFQEELDARLHPHGWDTAAYQPDGRWLRAMPIPGRADKPTLTLGYREYSTDSGATDPDQCQLRRRSVPLMSESIVLAARLQESATVRWHHDPLDWFENRTPGAFEIDRTPIAKEDAGRVQLPPTPERTGHLLTFEFAEQIVGWPRFTVEAPAGTVVELMVQESHDPKATAWLDTHHYAWSRFICREGVNEFECFDFESLRWMQLHIRSASGPVTVSGVSVRRRIYPWPNQPQIACSDGPLQRLFNASLNTLHNSCQDTIVDGMGRERQQYSGDCGHQLHAVRHAFGEYRQAGRYLATFSQGLTLDGYFLDCWPAYDRLARLAQRQVGATPWGPLLDHGVGFMFDCWNHYMESGDLESLREPYPRLVRFAKYLHSLRDAHGLLPVENIGVPTVWIDHEAYQRPRHKQCAFTLYAAAALTHALAPIGKALGDDAVSETFAGLGTDLLDCAVRRFWSAQRGLFVNNLPWLNEEGGRIRLCDRSLAMSILFDQCANDGAPAVTALADCPPEMGLSYPANAVWRMWALAKAGRIDVVLRELRTRWMGMRSVSENNALQEMWRARPDSTDQFSHCPAAPLCSLFMDIAGIRPTAPGYASLVVRPQLGDIDRLSLTAHTPRGPVRLRSVRDGAGHRVTITPPKGCQAVARVGGRTVALAAGRENEFVSPGAN